MRKTALTFVFIIACLIAAAPTYSQTATASATRKHVETLASDKFEGRLTGSPGEKLAGDYLIAQLKRMGAKPLPGMTDFRLPFTFTAGSKDGGSKVTVDKQTSIVVTGPDKQLVGEVAAKIRKLRKTDPYKAKGVKYEGEVIRRKAGKAGKK